MNWIKGILVFGMTIFAYPNISFNELDAKSATQAHHPKGKSAKKAPASHAKKPAKSGGFFGSLKSSFASLGAKVKAGAASLKDKAANGVACRAGAGEAPGKALFAMALKGEKLTDAHIVAAHASPGKHAKK